MPNIFKHFSLGKAESYVFPDVSTIKIEEETPKGTLKLKLEELTEGDEPMEEEDTAPVPDPNDPINYANIQADAILLDARRQAEEILEQAREAAKREAEVIHQQARDAGRQEGRLEGMAEAMEEGVRHREEVAAQLTKEVQQFLDRAGAALDRQLDDNLDDLRDLAIAIAEKVICVSLKSSTDVIGRMVQTALDKRKHREWVHIYIAECDMKRMGQIPASLTSAVSAFSNRVRIIPMADDESGTCIIEMPDEIIDASTSTQLANIKNLLMDAHQSDIDFINFSF